MNPFRRAVARFLVTRVAGGGGGEHIASAKGTNLVGGSVSSPMKWQTIIASYYNQNN